MLNYPSTIEKIIRKCQNFKNFVFDESFSLYELVMKMLEKLDEIADAFADFATTVVDYVNTFQAQIDKKEDSDNITKKRRLSPSGDFTGSIHGRDTLLVLSQVDTSLDDIRELTLQFADGATGLVIEGGFFTDGEIQRNYSGGVW
jgi:uncharacterized protein Yka (UPF0111/DUF47 family)